MALPVSTRDDVTFHILCDECTKDIESAKAGVEQITISYASVKATGNAWTIQVERDNMLGEPALLEKIKMPVIKTKMEKLLKGLSRYRGCQFRKPRFQRFTETIQTLIKHIEAILTVVYADYSGYVERRVLNAAPSCRDTLQDIILTGESADSFSAVIQRGEVVPSVTQLIVEIRERHAIVTRLQIKLKVIEDMLKDTSSLIEIELGKRNMGVNLHEVRVEKGDTMERTKAECQGSNTCVCEKGVVRTSLLKLLEHQDHSWKLQLLLVLLCAALIVCSVLSVISYWLRK